MQTQTAVLLGASGLIGSELLQLLLADSYFEEVRALVRRPLEVKDPKLNQIIVDFSDDDSLKEAIKGDVIFCCLGTTIRNAGSKAAFKLVDREYPLKAARIGIENGVQIFSIVTALGSDSGSMVFYNKVKGEVEQELKAMRYPSLQIFQPSLLLGERKEYRSGEEMAKLFMGVFSPLMIGPFKKYRAIQGKTVAKAMLLSAKESSEQLKVYQSDEIEALVS